jgi:hypothetical protein
MDSLIEKAIESRAHHFELGQPMIEAEGFKEANIAQDVSYAFLDSGYRVYPQFPAGGGSIDAVSVKGAEVIICEWKRAYPGSFGDIVSQTERMLRFDPAVELPPHRFRTQPWVTRWLWVCDAWDKPTIDWWHGRSVSVRCPCPFNGGWTVGSHTFPGLRWPLYVWLWAYK